VLLVDLRSGITPIRFSRELLLMQGIRRIPTLLIGRPELFNAGVHNIKLLGSVMVRTSDLINGLRLWLTAVHCWVSTWIGGG